MKYSFKELFDLSKMQKLINEFSRFTSISLSIISMDGDVLICSGWQRICSQFHMQDPQARKECLKSNTKIRREFKKGVPFVIYNCPHGLVDASFPIVIAGKHLASLVSGQIFLEPPDKAKEKLFKEQARKFGFDEALYLKLFSEIPVFTEEKFRSVLLFLAQIVQIITQLGTSRLNVLEAEKRLKLCETKLKSSFKESAEALHISHLASLGELSAGVVHEINNPIAGIISIAEILVDQFHKLGGDKKIPERIVHEGERIANIVKNMLSFATDKKDERNFVYIYDILKLTLELVEKQIIKDGIKLSVNILSDLPGINACSQEIQQVFFNIISNARYALKKKYPTPHENKIFEIKGKVIISEEKKYVRLIFYDRGLGIPRDFLDKVTDPFFSTKPRGEGTGLGLSISHGIIEAHGGKLLFESKEGEYTKVMVDLPIHKVPNPEEKL
ncbi:sensor histidine kinase [Desulfobacula toluolica]|uniref:histidine kinase n=1 Tax=Desulfobacula toluolica (strain DSM 7467 / Tol2) TaxID=651182 RepID=K0NEL4_DESTT|nr:PocR ligand-binding domain-containing protein [Desulfobacula toluolica]CCK79350.1 two component system sensor histidine kinase [Desulfobacula toluolica Tol2]